MILIMIDNKTFLTKIMKYFDYSKIPYTTDNEDNYEYFLLAELNNKNIKLINDNIKKGKKIIFITYLEEPKILKHFHLNSYYSLKYKDNLFRTLNKCYIVIVSLPFFKKVLNGSINTKIEIIERENPKLELNKKVSKSKKNIICIDQDYLNISSIFKLANQYSKYNFFILGFSPLYKLDIKTKGYLKIIPNNIKMIKDYDDSRVLEYCQSGFLIISFDTESLSSNNLYYAILLKKMILLKTSQLYDDYLINSKNTYLFSNYNELEIKFKKILYHRVGNLTNEAYDLIKNNTFEEIAIKFSKYLQ